MSNLLLKIPKERVYFDEDFAVVDTGMEQEDFIIAMLKYVGSGKDTMAVVRKDKEGCKDEES